VGHPQRKSETENIQAVKNERTAQNFAKIRSVIDTTIKNNMNVMEVLALITKLRPKLTTD
jgi:hypothetical protein